MVPWEFSINEQPTGLCTAECPSQGEMTSAIRRLSEGGSSSVRTTMLKNDNVSAPVPVSATSPSNSPPRSPKRNSRTQFFRSFSFRTLKSKKFGSSSYRSDGNLGSSIRSLSESAPTILIRTPLDDSRSCFPGPIRSSMYISTLHDSLHLGKLSEGTRNQKIKRSVSFAEVRIREYERVLGDNPSVTSGPPLSLGWGYTPEPTCMKIDDFEEGKGLPRTSAEFLVPRAVREQMLKEHANVSRSEIVKAVRSVNQTKNQRRKTVVNLGMASTEEKVEGAKRKVKKILGVRANYEVEEARLWDKAHAVALEKAKALEESINRGEIVSMKHMYNVGTPRNNIIASPRQLPASKENTENTEEGSCDDLCPSSEVADFTSAENKTGPSSGNKLDDCQDSQLVKDSDLPEPLRIRRRSSFSGPFSSKQDVDSDVCVSDNIRASFRCSDSDITSCKDSPPRFNAIIASESDDLSEEIFSKLLLDS